MKKLLRLVTFLLLLSIPHGAKANFNDSLRILTALPNDTAKVTALNDFALRISNSNSDSAILVSGQALQLTQQLKWDEGIARTFHLLGLFNSTKGENKLALDYYFKALYIRERQEVSVPAGKKRRVLETKWKTLSNIGAVYMDMGDYPRALNYFFRALSTAERISDKSGICTTLGNIATVYMEQGFPEKALDYYFRSLAVEETLKNKAGIAITLGNIGSVYNDKGEYEKAQGYYASALKLSQESGDMDGVATCLGNIGMAYENLKDTVKAIDYYFRALKTAQETGNAETIATQYRSIGSLYAESGRYRDGEEYLLQALSLDESTGALPHVMDDEKALSDLYATTGRPALALGHYKKYAAAKDSVYNQENTAKSVRSEMNYEFEKKEASQKAAHDKAVLALSAENRIAKNTRNFIIESALMLVLVIIFGFTWYNNRRHLRTKNEHSRQLLLSQEKERQRISKELHDSIGQNMLFIKNQLIKQNDTVLLVSVNETLEEVRNISKDLYPNQLERYGLAAAVDALAEKVNESSSIFVSYDLDALSRELPSDKQINYYRILQECVTNTLKHSEATALRITANRAGGMIELVVQDNGKGFDKLILAKKAQRSFGLLNIEERVSYLEGRFELQTAPGKGTKYIFTLPA